MLDGDACSETDRLSLEGGAAASSWAACHKPSAVSFFFSNIFLIFETLLALSLDAVDGLVISADSCLDSDGGGVFDSNVDGLSATVDIEGLLVSVDIDNSGASLDAENFSGSVYIAGLSASVDIDVISGSVGVAGPSASSVDVDLLSASPSKVGVGAVI